VPVRADRNDGRAQLVFGSIAGKAEVWVDGIKLADKAGAEPAPFAVTLPQGGPRRQVTVLVEATAGQPSGLGGRVVLEPGAR
jgi:beta-galactosidase